MGAGGVCADLSTDEGRVSRHPIVRWVRTCDRSWILPCRLARPLFDGEQVGCKDAFGAGEVGYIDNCGRLHTNISSKRASLPRSFTFHRHTPSDSTSQPFHTH